MHYVLDYKILMIGSIKFKILNGYNSYYEFLDKLKSSDSPYCYFILKIPVKLKKNAIKLY